MRGGAMTMASAKMAEKERHAAGARVQSTGSVCRQCTGSVQQTEDVSMQKQTRGTCSCSCSVHVHGG
jgi:hypothetical protein